MEEIKKQTKKRNRVYKTGKDHHLYGISNLGSDSPSWKGGQKEKIKRFRNNNPEVEKYNGTKARAKILKIPHTISLLDFRKWYKETNKMCVYCGLDISVKTGKRMSNLSIDRKYNEIGYVLSNCCFACNRCNTVKGNTFTYDEMVEIGNKYLNIKNKETITSL